MLARPLSSGSSPIGSLPWLLLSPLASAGQEAPPPSPFATVQQPLPWVLHEPQLVRADLDRDGVDELLAGGGDGFVGLLRFDVRGAVHPEQLPVPDRVEELAVADLDGDGWMDVAAATWGGLVVLWNDGAGQLGAPLLVAPDDHVAVRAGDLNGDGVADLFTAQFGVGLRTWLGTGGHAFVPGSVLGPVGGTPIALGDWNEDGDLDAVAINLTGIRVLLGDGQGGLVPDELVLHPWPDGLLAADVDGDGHLDLVSHDDRKVLPVLLGDGQAGFHPEPESSGSWTAYPTSLDAGDLDGDGLPDLLVCDGEVFVMRGSPSQTLLRGEGLPLGSAQAVALADVDGDGRLDAVAWRVADPGHGPSDPAPGWLTVGHGDGRGGLRGVRRTAAEACAFPSTPHTALGDLDGDGALDLVEASWFGPFARTYLADGSGGWRPATTLALQNKVDELQLADADRDGRLDLIYVLSWKSQVVVHPGDARGGFGSPIETDLGLGSVSLAGPLADFDEDGALDLLSFTWEPSGSTLTVHPGDGRGGFGRPLSQLELGVPSRLVASDLDLDGHLDLLVVHWGSGKGRVQAWSGDGTGGFPKGLALPALPGPPASALLVEDLEGDGLPDILLGFSVPGQPGYEVAVLRGVAPGVFHPPAAILTSGWPTRLLAGDMDGDGRLDLVLGEGAGDSIRILRGDGLGGFCTWLRLGGWRELLALADMDRDGDLDLVLPGVTLLDTAP